MTYSRKIGPNTLFGWYFHWSSQHPNLSNRKFRRLNNSLVKSIGPRSFQCLGVFFTSQKIIHNRNKKPHSGTLPARALQTISSHLQLESTFW
jgi:hypothetical protein